MHLMLNAYMNIKSCNNASKCHKEPLPEDMRREKKYRKDRKTTPDRLTIQQLEHQPELLLDDEAGEVGDHVVMVTGRHGRDLFLPEGEGEK